MVQKEKNITPVKRSKKALRAEAAKKAGRKKKITRIAVIAGIIVVFVLLIFFLSSERKEINVSSADTSVDVDLTAMSITMATAKLNEILKSPEDYLAKTVKVRGEYTFLSDANGATHYIMVGDKDDCCNIWVEIMLPSDAAGSGGYPADRKRIEIISSFKSYESNGRANYYFEIDDVLVLN